jgi:hypothetical protein
MPARPAFARVDEVTDVGYRTQNGIFADARDPRRTPYSYGDESQAPLNPISNFPSSM